MSSMIVVPAQVTLKSIDAALRQIEEFPDASLTIPPSVSFRSVLSAALYLQLLITWARKKSPRSVHLTAKHQDSDFLGLSAESFAPIALADDVTVTWTDTGTTEKLARESVLDAGLNIHSQLKGGLPYQPTLFGEEEFASSEIPRKGSRIHFFAMDSFGAYGTPNWFYKGPPEARQMRAPQDFASLVRSAINVLKTKSGGKFAIRIDDNIAEDLGGMLFELIDNTHRWGRHDTSEAPVGSMRGALFDMRFDYPGNQSKLADIASEIPLVGEYIQYHQTKKGVRSLGLLEMTVFDGGIGLPARELRRRGVSSPTLAEEYDATIACLRKWGTTSQQKGRGLGLDKVLELASKHQGLVYLRTGTLALYRDFANKPDSEQAGGASVKHHLDDAINLNLHPTPCPRVEGTLLSVVLPFNADVNS